MFLVLQCSWCVTLGALLLVHYSSNGLHQGMSYIGLLCPRYVAGCSVVHMTIGLLGILLGGEQAVLVYVYIPTLLVLRCAR